MSKLEALSKNYVCVNKQKKAPRLVLDSVQREDEESNYNKIFNNNKPTSGLNPNNAPTESLEVKGKVESVIQNEAGNNNNNLILSRDPSGTQIKGRINTLGKEESNLDSEKRTLEIHQPYKSPTIRSLKNDKLIQLQKNIEDKSETNKDDSSDNNQPGSNLNFITVKHNGIESNYQISIQPQKCLICDRSFFATELSKTSNCRHFICRKCLKRYYEEKIEEGTFDPKCPIFFCKEKFEIEYIKTLVTKEHFNAISGKESKLTEFKEEVDLLANITARKTILSFEHMKKYSQKHVIDLNSNEQFFFYKRAKGSFCQKCSEMALFGKADTQFVKCLNCFYCFCKYCLKSFDEDHMKIIKENHCKVCFRQEEDNSEKKQDNCMCIFLREGILFTIIAFIAMLCALFCYLYSFFLSMLSCGNILAKRKCIVLSFTYFYTIIIWLCLAPIILVLYPFFPVFISIFG